jgi:hypothetical protein
MNQALYAHMNNKRKMKKKVPLMSHSKWQKQDSNLDLSTLKAPFQLTTLPERIDEKERRREKTGAPRNKLYGHQRGNE